MDRDRPNIGPTVRNPDDPVDGCPWCSGPVVVHELEGGTVTTCRRVGCYWWRLRDELGQVDQDPRVRGDLR